MRLSHSLILAGALFVASPALAQDNAATTDNTIASNGVDANAAMTPPADTAATPVAPQDSAPPSVATPADTGATTAPPPTKRGLPWGLLGLLGLIGLFGARKMKA